MSDNSIIQEISLEETVYDIHGKAVVNQNPDNSSVPYKFDWVGSYQEYQDQDIETNHPEWICYITDDLQGGISVYTKQQVDDAVVHKTLDETISGNKVFNNTITLHDNITPSNHLSKPSPIEDQIIDIAENTNEKIDGFSVTRYQDMTGNREIKVKGGFRSSDDSADLYPTISLGVDPTNNFYVSTNASPAIYSNNSNLATTQFVQNVLPVGVILPYAGTNTPQGYFTCDGSEISRVTYSKLFEAIGTTYGGGDGYNTFNIPNTSHRVLWSAGTWSVGETYEAGLPNITGMSSWDFMGDRYSVDSQNEGALIKYDGKKGNAPRTVTNRYVWTNGNVTDANNKNYLDFDASRSNNIYGSSNTVRPRCIVVKYIIKYI